ncbi:MAG: Family membership [Candidatus Saccharibacteria bacterium GW2011_GWC2_48_9]|nr:MAG: Family membership [Candidatus Saccharibacteria bacterium GW2011_GWC2_48_9]HCH34332.1 hypothetical protein [Candidatus Saccharibacteria bacterium]
MERKPKTTQKAEAHIAVRQARRSSDFVVLGAGIFASLAIMAGVFFTGVASVLYGEEIVDEYAATDPAADFIGNAIGFGIVAILLLAVILTLVRMMRQQMLGNALQVEYSDYAWLREWSNTVASDLQMPRVEIMVTQDPVINAYAFGFASPYTIVLHSGAIRWLTHDQLKAVVVHEMGHVKYHHTKISTYLGMLRLVPVVGAVNGWLLDFWSRRAEYTADRLALCYLRNNEQVKSSLIGVHVGPDVARSFNEVARQWQVYMTSNYFNRFTQTFSSHPFLVRRLARLDSSAAQLLASGAAGTVPSKTSSSKVVEK